MSSVKEILTGVPQGSLGQTKSSLVSQNWPGENFYITHPPTYDIVEHVSEYTFLISKNKQKKQKTKTKTKTKNKQTNKNTKKEKKLKKKRQHLQKID